MADYTITTGMPATVVAIDQPTADRLEALMERAALMRVVSVEAHAQASAMCSELHAAWKALEAKRESLKAPALALGKQIDAIARPFLLGLEEQKRALQVRVATFEAAENARRAEENRRAQEAAQERERELAEKAAADACPLDDPMDAPVIRVDPPPPKAPLQSSVSTRPAPPRLVIDDVTLIPAVVSNVRTMIPDERAILALLKAGVAVPGCKLVREMQASQKPGSA